MMAVESLRALNLGNINPNVQAAKYAVRGELALRSEIYREQLAKGQKGDLPFDAVISANIGNPQQLGQQPITFFRQVASLLEYPPLLNKDSILINDLGYQQDVIERAKILLGAVKSVGAYSQSQGAPMIRESVAKFIEKRDGYPANPVDIYLTAGASSGVNTLLNIMCAKPESGILVPIPQYPLYTATLSVINARCVPYYLDESRSWGINLAEIRSTYEKAIANGTDVKALVMINPGNPTGASLSEQDVKSVLEFAAEKKLVIIADEVYQTNVFIGKFYSFKKVLRDLQNSCPGPYNNVELASLHSVSKGMVGECGHRGGYLELVGFDPDVLTQIYKFVSIQLCPPVIGQCMVELMVNPPQEGDPSYELYNKEYSDIYDGLKRRAYSLYEAFKQMEGVSCDEPQGAMYLFPSISLPQKAMDKAKQEGRQPDEFYSSRLLDATGVCVVPGSGFGQKEGSQHFRTTFLAPGTDWVDRITSFHAQFMNEFRDSADEGQIS